MSAVVVVAVTFIGGVAVGWYAHREERRMTERANHETTKANARFLAHERDIYEEAWIQAREQLGAALEALEQYRSEA